MLIVDLDELGKRLSFVKREFCELCIVLATTNDLAHSHSSLSFLLRIGCHSDEVLGKLAVLESHALFEMILQLFGRHLYLVVLESSSVKPGLRDVKLVEDFIFCRLAVEVVASIGILNVRHLPASIKIFLLVLGHEHLVHPQVFLVVLLKLVDRVDNW